MRVAVALRSILRDADANKALGLTASEGTPVDMATHVRRARAVWPHMLAGCSLREAIDKLKEDEHARADDVSFESYRNSFRVLKKQLMSEALSNWTDDALTPLERAAFAEMMGKLPR